METMPYLAIRSAASLIVLERGFAVVRQLYFR